MSIYPRMYAKGLNVQTYNATYDTPYLTLNDIVTSQYDPKTNRFVSLGTVFMFINYGYEYIINGGSYDIAVQNRWDGASRMIFYPSTPDLHPQQMCALVGFYAGSAGGVRPLTYPGYYPTPDTYRHVTGLVGLEMSPLADFSYFTLVYDVGQTEASGYPILSLYHSANITFTPDDTGNYPTVIDGISGDTLYGVDGWVLGSVDFIPIDVIVPLPGYAVTVTQRGETGIVVGAELQDASGNVIEDISTKVQYSIVGTENASIDSNRQLIIANEGELPESFEIKIVWINMPFEPHNILVSVDIDDAGGDGGGGGEGGDTDVTEIDISTQLGLVIGLGLEGWATRGDTNV